MEFAIAKAVYGLAVGITHFIAEHEDKSRVEWWRSRISHDTAHVLANSSEQTPSNHGRRAFLLILPSLPSRLRYTTYRLDWEIDIITWCCVFLFSIIIWKLLTVTTNQTCDSFTNGDASTRACKSLADTFHDITATSLQEDLAFPLIGFVCNIRIFVLAGVRCWTV
jgi:hypothetical protein